MLQQLHLPSFKAIHKGSHGRIAIIGGSEHYTGAPFFSGISALHTGADLVSILTHPLALLPIKSYSPDLMVSDYNDKEHFVRTIDKSHAIVIGPGLARHPDTEMILNQIKAHPDIPVVVDADGLHFYKPGIFKNVILTPNAHEFKQINPNNLSEQNLAKYLQATILLKGDSDKVITESSITTIDERSTLRRCGGQGDILTGILAVFSAWNPNNLPIAAINASKLLRRSARLSFEASKGRSQITSDIPNFIGEAFHQLFPNDSEYRSKF